ncbi:MAG: PRC-barrel domain-containing protein [Bacteroidota bacterium]|nr:PRC-barrel domain-containing protein [Bacteroidota bacterium]
MDYQLLSTSSLSGTNITNRKGENLGDLKDIMLDLESGEVAYAVISFGGFLGIGDKLFAVPWESFTFDKVNEQIIMDVNKETLENAPGFDKDNWPSSPDRQFVESVHSHYGYKPYWERRSNMDSVGSDRDSGTGFGSGSASSTSGYGDSGFGNSGSGSMGTGNSGLGNSGDDLSDEGRIRGSRIRESGFGGRTTGSDPDDSGFNTGNL